MWDVFLEIKILKLSYVNYCMLVYYYVIYVLYVSIYINLMFSD